VSPLGALGFAGVRGAPSAPFMTCTSTILFGISLCDLMIPDRLLYHLDFLHRPYGSNYFPCPAGGDLWRTCAVAHRFSHAFSLDWKVCYPDCWASSHGRVPLLCVVKQQDSRCNLDESYSPWLSSRKFAVGIGLWLHQAIVGLIAVPRLTRP
jgi:hypothetical protein